MRDLTKKYRLLYKNGEIMNPDYLEEQTGHTYPAYDLEAVEFDELSELKKYVEDHALIEKDWFGMGGTP